MSLTRTTTIWCDAKGCTSWLETVEPVAKARRDFGWVLVNGKDYCSECASKKPKKASHG